MKTIPLEQAKRLSELGIREKAKYWHCGIADYEQNTDFIDKWFLCEKMPNGTFMHFINWGDIKQVTPMEKPYPAYTLDELFDVAKELNSTDDYWTFWDFHRFWQDRKQDILTALYEWVCEMSKEVKDE